MLLFENGGDMLINMEEHENNPTHAPLDSSYMEAEHEIIFGETPLWSIHRGEVRVVVSSRMRMLVKMRRMRMVRRNLWRRIRICEMTLLQMRRMRMMRMLEMTLLPVMMSKSMKMWKVTLLPMRRMRLTMHLNLELERSVKPEHKNL